MKALSSTRTTTDMSEPAGCEPADVKPIHTWLILASIMLVGLLLRLYHIDSQSVWRDEYDGLGFTNAPNVVECIKAQRPINPQLVPLYFALEYLWANAVGKSTVAIRMLSVLSGLLAIPLTFLLGRELYGRRAGLVAATCIALSSVHIFLSQEIRNYSLTVLFALCSGYTFVRLAKDDGGRWWVLHALANLALIWTHLFGCFLLVAEGCFLLLFRWRRFKRVAAWCVIHALLLIPSILWIRTMPFRNQMAFAKPPLWHVVNNIFTDCASCLYFPFPGSVLGGAIENPAPAWTRAFIASYRQADAALLYLFVASIAVLAIILLRQRRRDSLERLFFPLLWLLLPPVTLFVLARTWRADFFGAKYTVYCSVAAYAMLGGAIQYIRWPFVRRLAIGAVLLLFCHRLVLYSTQTQRTDWLSATRMVKLSGTPNDLTIVTDPVQHYVCQYNMNDPAYEVDRTLNLRELCEKVEANLGKGRNIWVMWLTFDKPAIEGIERYLGLRKIPFERKEFWAAQLPGLLVQHLKCPPGFQSAAVSAPQSAFDQISEESVRQFRESAEARRREGNRLALMNTLSGAVQLKPWDEAFACELMEVLLCDFRGYPAIEETARQLLRYRPEHPRAFAYLAVALSSAGKHAEAKEAFRNAIARYPGDFEQIPRDIVTLLNCGDGPKAAVERLRKALAEATYDGSLEANFAAALAD